MNEIFNESCLFDGKKKKRKMRNESIFELFLIKPNHLNFKKQKNE